MSNFQKFDSISNSNVQNANVNVRYGSSSGRNGTNDCLDPENTSKCCFFKVANAFLLLANMLLLIVGFYHLPTKQDNAYFSVIVSVLAILVTVLITWQIWQTVASREELRRVERIGKKYDDLSKQVEMLKEIPEGFLYHTLAMSYLDKKDYTWAFIHLGWAVEQLIKGQADYVKHIAHNIDLMDACLINLVNGHGDVDFFLCNKDWIDKAIDNLIVGITNLGKWTFDAQQKVDNIKGLVTQIRRNAEEKARAEGKPDNPTDSK